MKNLIFSEEFRRSDQTIELPDVDVFRVRDLFVNFTLHAGNGQVIGKSEMYTSSQDRDGGIAAVKAYGPTAPTVDLT